MIDFALRATLILLIAGAVTLGMSRAPAAARHLVWVLAFAGLIAVPLATTFLPAWPIPVLRKEAATPEATPVTTVRAPATTVEHPRPSESRSPLPAPRPLPTDWTLLVGWIWLAGAALTLGALFIGLLRLGLLARSAEPVTAERWTQLVHMLSAELGLRRRVTLLRAAGPAMPMTWGVARPVILLPREADEWPEARRRQVLLHELAHVRRYDVLTQLVARVVCAAYWFHPLVWVAAARLRVERERACDDLVLRSGARPSDYAGNLLEIARSLRVTPAAAFASVAMARPSQLATRLLDVLDGERRRGAVTRRAAVPATMAAAAIALPLALAIPVYRAVERPQQPAAKPDASASATRSAEARASSRSVSGHIVETSGVAGDSVCDGSGTPRRRSSVHVNNGTAVHLTIGRCDVIFKAEGDYEFTDDWKDIASVSRGGEVTVEFDDGRTLHRLVITPGPGGSLQREYTVDRETRPWDADAKAWLARTLLLMFRSSGLAASERAQWILEKQGIDSLVNEITLLSGDYTRRQYYDVAVTSGKLDDAATERLVRKAGQEISSDYELAELLINLSAHRALTAGMQEGFVAAAGTIQSDYERRRVLDAALERRDLTPAVAAAMLESAADINSDYELAELLIGIQRVRPMDDAVREAFFTAANTLQSDYEHRRVLSAVFSGQNSSAAMLDAALASAAGIRSDYELAEFLTQVAGSNAMSEAVSKPYLAAVRTLQSDHEAGRALAALADRPNLPAAVVRDLLLTAQVIQSDYELAELLIGIARTRKIDEALKPAFDAAAATLQSQYEFDRVMVAAGRVPRRSQSL